MKRLDIFFSRKLTASHGKGRITPLQMHCKTINLVIKNISDYFFDLWNKNSDFILYDLAALPELIRVTKPELQHNTH